MCKKLQNIINKCKISLKKRKNDKNKVKNRIKIAIHPVTIAFAIISIFCGMFWLFFMYFMCIFVHEICHYLVAKKLGYFCSKITLYPSGALLSGATDEFTFKDEILISIAGPLSNIIMCIICVFLWWILPEIFNYTADFVVANLSIAFFNFLPIFPLDGGRVLLAILSNHLPRKKASLITRHITVVVAIILFAIFVLTLFFTPNFQIGISAIVIFISVLSEDKEAVYKRIVKTDIKRRRLKHGLKVTTLMFNKQTTLSRVLSKIDNFAFYNIYVVDDDFNILATVSEVELYKLVEVSSLTETLGSALLLK